MNILFFLTPKSEAAYVYDSDTLRQALEKWNITGILLFRLLEEKMERMWEP